MKKFLPYILILVIIANIFAPFTLSLNQKKVTIDKVVTEAADTTTQNVDFSDLGVGTEIKLETGLGFIKATVVKRDFQYSEIEFSIFQTVSGGQLKQIGISQNINYTKFDINNPPPTFIEFKNLANGNYTVKIITTDNSSATSAIVQEKRVAVVVSASGAQTTVTDSDLNSGTGLETNKEADVLPKCATGYMSVDLVGCAIVIYYNILFVPTSYLFGLGGKFFDATFGYSILDSSYRSGFVTEGWGIVRDFCNLFFIFVLIYAAFGMILSIHSIKAKEILINTIIIGLLINFSLFAGQVLIDASNILARVFYNSEAIKITVDKNGGTVDRGGVNMYDQTVAMGQLPLSAAIVSKIDPQNLIINGKSQIQNVGDTTENYSGLSAGGWFLIITLAVIVNVVGTFVFLSVGLIFVARVIGLWFSLIFAPFAFFSYTVPQMQGVPMVGWKKWWPETMGLAFVAPIFMFFMYLILVFLERGFVSLIEASNGPNFVLSIIIPFVFIMILLMTAKKLAKSYSGQMGQMITGAVTATGAALLGGAALGTAVLGRKIIGNTVARASRGETATQRYESGTAKGLAKVTGFLGSVTGLGTVYGKKNITTGEIDNGIGGFLNKKQRSVADVDHARADLEKAKEAAHLKGIPDSKLSGANVEQIKKEFNKMKKSEVESSLRKGEDLKGNKITGIESEEEYKKSKRKQEVTDMEGKTGRKEKDFTDSERKEIENTINNNYNTYLKDNTDTQLKGLFDHTKDEAGGRDSKGERVWLTDRIMAKSNTGSYDVRNLSQSKADSRANILTKIGVGAVASIALGIRTGLKGLDINHGKGQGDFLKDLGHTITEAMKSAKFKVDIPSGGGHDDHAGGHDDHGHGGGGGGHH